MANIRLAKSELCYISATKAWHSWLSAFNIELYRKFVKLIEKSGCSGAGNAVSTVLGITENLDFRATMAFLLKEFSYSIRRVPVFGEFRVGLCTVPMRVIRADGCSEAEVKKFLSTVGPSDYVGFGGVWFIEYVWPNVPMEGLTWLVTKHRQT